VKNLSASESFLKQFPVTGNLVGVAGINARVYDSTYLVCESETPTFVNVTPALPWWQVIGGDVIVTGSIKSSIPSICAPNTCKPNLIIVDDVTKEDFGIAAYSSDLKLNSKPVSDVKWQTETEFKETGYNYRFFEKRIPEGFATPITSSVLSTSTLESGGVPYQGYYVFSYNGDWGDLTIDGGDIDIGSRRIVLYVKDASLFIKSKINLDDGLGFFIAIVDKDIRIDKAVGGLQESPDKLPDLEGIYFANRIFYTGEGSSQLHIRGSVAGLGYSSSGEEGFYESIVLQRDLDEANANTPAEIFEYAPDQILRIPSFVGVRQVRWAESNP